jgi:hypothetical protein
MHLSPADLRGVASGGVALAGGALVLNLTVAALLAPLWLVGRRGRA